MSGDYCSESVSAVANLIIDKLHSHSRRNMEKHFQDSLISLTHPHLLFNVYKDYLFETSEHTKLPGYYTYTMRQTRYLEG